MQRFKTHRDQTFHIPKTLLHIQQNISCSLPVLLCNRTTETLLYFHLGCLQDLTDLCTSTFYLEKKKNAAHPVYSCSVFQTQFKPRIQNFKLSQQQSVLINSHSKLGLLGKSQGLFSCTRRQRKDKQDLYGQRHPNKSQKPGAISVLSWIQCSCPGTWGGGETCQPLARLLLREAMPARPVPATVLHFSQLLLLGLSLSRRGDEDKREH